MKIIPEKVSLGKSDMHIDKLSLKPCDSKGNWRLIFSLQYYPRIKH